MARRRISLYALWGTLLLSAGAYEALCATSEGTAAGGPVVESIEGASSLQVHGADGTVRTEAAGGELREGDWLDTPQDTVCRLIFGQGSQMLITGGSRIEVREEPSDEGGPRVPVVLVGRGEVRTLVEPAAPIASAGTAAPKKPLRFLIRTKTAVMGVRGTDFVVLADGAQSSVHTIEGTVDVGRDTAEVKGGNAVPVPANQFVESHAGIGIAPPKPFAAAQYLEQLHQRHPRLQAAWHRAVNDSRSGRLRQRYRQLHQRHARRQLRRGAVHRVSPDAHVSRGTVGSRSGHGGQRKEGQHKNGQRRKEGQRRTPRKRR